MNREKINTRHRELVIKALNTPYTLNQHHKIYQPEFKIGKILFYVPSKEGRRVGTALTKINILQVL